MDKGFLSGLDQSEPAGRVWKYRRDLERSLNFQVA